jgi:hypothetical protein
MVWIMNVDRRIRTRRILGSQEFGGGYIDIEATRKPSEQNTRSTCLAKIFDSGRTQLPCQYRRSRIKDDDCRFHLDIKDISGSSSC